MLTPEDDNLMKMSEKFEINVLLAAGGTGGHLFPAIALAEELLAQGHKVTLAVDERTANYKFPEGVTVKVLAVKSPSGGLTQKIQAVLGLLKSVVQLWGIMQQNPPQVVVGFGGYPSFPALAMAMARGIPLVLHEQNRFLGKANRMAANKAKAIALSFPGTRGIAPQNESKCVAVGNPPRHEMQALYAVPYEAPQEGQPIELLVFAGSQGARLFSEVVPAAIGKLPENLRSRLRVTQQCRAEDIEKARAEYAAQGVSAEIAPFFHDIPQRLQKAHLVVCRSGASTITELTMAARPAIYIPLAIAADDHQTFNAQYMEENHAGWLLPQSLFEADSLAARLEHCLSNPQLLQQTATAARALAWPDAAKKLAGVVIASAT